MLNKAVEGVARTIFEHWQFQPKAIRPVKWTDGGNSEKQMEARSYAQSAIFTLTALGWLPPEEVAAKFKRQHDIIGLQMASLEAADLEIARLNEFNPFPKAGIERAALEKAAATLRTEAEIALNEHNLKADNAKLREALKPFAEAPKDETAWLVESFSGQHDNYLAGFSLAAVVLFVILPTALYLWGMI